MNISSYLYRSITVFKFCKEGNKRRSAEIVADSVYFGDSKAKEGQEPPASTGGPVEAAGGDPFGSLPGGFAPNVGEPADDGTLPF